MHTRTLFLPIILLASAIGLAWLVETHPPQPVALIPTLTGQVEYCLTCHADLAEISPSHPVEEFGCVLCHAGERLALQADLAHSGMRGGKNPSDLAVVEESCGGEACHDGASAEWRNHIQRVMTSIQATYTGAITFVRYTSGAQADLIPIYAIATVQDTTLPSITNLLSLAAFDPAAETIPALQTFAENCLTCHLRAQPPAGAQYARFTGCSACHSPLSTQDSQGQVHILTTAMPYTQCNTCHFRGAYDPRTMTFTERSDQPASRRTDMYPADSLLARCEITLDCVDCHTHIEAMGCGDLHVDKAEVQHVQCSTCHGTATELPLTRTLTDPNDLAFRLASLNPVISLQLGDTVVISEHHDEPFWNIRRLADGSYELISKITGERYIFRAVLNTACQQNPQEQEARYCHACHTEQH